MGEDTDYLDDLTTSLEDHFLWEDAKRKKVEAGATGTCKEDVTRNLNHSGVFKREMYRRQAHAKYARNYASI